MAHIHIKFHETMSITVAGLISGVPRFSSRP